MRRRYGVVAVLLAAVVLAGCSSGGDPPPEPALVEAWRVRSITPIGQPVAVGDMMVAYGTVERDLLVYAVPIGEGIIRWRKAASPSVVATGIPVRPTVIGDRVAYFRPDNFGNLAARLVVASANTGADLLVSAPMHFVSHPGTCSDGKDVCVTAHDGHRLVARRFSVEAGGPIPDPGAPPPGSRLVGEDLRDLGGREPEILAGVSGAATRWRSPITTHFSTGYSTDYGWYFELYRSAGLHVGSVGHPSDRSDPSTTVVDLTKHETAAIRAADGSPAWRAEGTDFSCGRKITLQRKVDDRSEHLPVRCRYRGVARYDQTSKAVAYDGLDVTVEGFDVATGETTWSVPLGAAEAFMKEETPATVVSNTEVLLQAENGPVIVDVASGSSRPPEVGESFWCGDDVIFRFRERWSRKNGSSGDSWRGGTLVRRCAADGSPTDVAPRHIPPSLGATVGDRTVVAEAGGLVAYERGAP